MATAALSRLVDAMADQIRDALETALTGTGVTVQVEPRRVLKLEDTTVDIYPAADDFRDQTTAGMGSVSGGYRFTVRARLASADEDAPQDLLLDMHDDASGLSIAQALYDDPTINGFATDVFIEAFSGHRVYQELDGALALGCEWTVLVLRAES